MPDSSLRHRLRRLRAAWNATTPASETDARATQADLRAAEHALLAAQRQIATLTARVAALEDGIGALRRPHGRPRVAFFSPVTPQASGIAAYSETLLPALAALADVDVYISDVTPTSPALMPLSVYDYRAYPARRRAQAYDATFYQMGNDVRYHRFVYATLARYPGVVVLHEFLLHHFMAGYTLDYGQRVDYPWEVGYAAGQDALTVARAAERGERDLPFFDYPLVEHALDLSQGALCHSEYVRARIAAIRPDLPVAVVAHPTTVTAAARPPVADRPFTVITAGYLTPAKGLLPALEGFAEFARAAPGARYVLVGAVEPEFDLAAWIRDSGIADRVELRGYAPTLADFDAQVAEADVCLNLRYPTGGETSGSLLRVLGVGVPAVITDTGWFSEVPDTVVIKIPAPPTAGDVADALRVMAKPDRRATMSDAARRWVAEAHNPARTAQGYLDFVAALT